MSERYFRIFGRGRMGRGAVLVVLAAALIGSTVACGRNDPNAAQPPPAGAAEKAGVVEVPEEAQRNGGLQTVTVQSRVIPATIEVTGSVQPDSAQVAHIRPLARGVIESLAVRLGSRVVPGQPLLAYDNIEMGTLTGEYLSEVAAQRQAESDLEVRQRAVERAEELIKLEAIAQQTLEGRRAEFKNAQAAVASQKARVSKIEEQLHRFGLSDPDLASLTPQEGASGHRTASHGVLRASQGGVVTKFEVAVGELVEPERELMTISDISTVWVLADVYEKDLAKITINTDVNIRADAYPDRVFVGRLTYIADTIDPQSRTVKVRCVVANRDGALKLDMFVKVSVPTTDSRQTLIVPAAAIQQIEGQSVVFVRQTPLRFERRVVDVGVSAGDVVEIKSGVRDGEVVAGAGSFYLKTALLRERIGGE